MVEQKEKDWQDIIEKLANPPDGFKVFKSPWWPGLSPEEKKEEEKKILMLATKLMNEWLYISDEYRNYNVIHTLIHRYFHGVLPSAIYEFGDFDGLLGFVNIQPGYKADVIFKIWNKETWGADFARQLKEFVESIMDTLDLKRLTVCSPDAVMVKLGRMMGFKREGMKKQDFKWDGTFYTTYILGKVRE